MDFSLGSRLEELLGQVRSFMDEHVYPVEAEAMAALDEEVRPGVAYPEIIVGIREKAREQGLWNMFMPGEEHGHRTDQLGVRAALRGDGPQPGRRARWRSTARPPTPALEILADHGTDEQKREWLEPLLNGDIRSCFSMTEPDVAGSDPTTLQTRRRARRADAGEWVINGHKWFTSGAVGASLAIAMVVTDPDAHPYARAQHDLRARRQSGFRPRPPDLGDGP